MKTNANALPMTKSGSHSRQGDTLLRRLDTCIPSTVKRIKRPTLALGEKTGHHHTFSEGGAVAFADDEKAPVAEYVRVTVPEAPLTHQEHETIRFPKGDYESLKQVEDTAEEVRAVQD